VAKGGWQEKYGYAAIIRPNARHVIFRPPRRFSQYRQGDGTIELLHTEVDPDFEGKGFGSKLAAAVLADVTGRELRVVVLCPFISAYVRRHRADYPGIELERERNPSP
jgi:predicted GNAT family acetyltransferase